MLVVHLKARKMGVRNSGLIEEVAPCELKDLSELDLGP